MGQIIPESSNPSTGRITPRAGGYSKPTANTHIKVDGDL